MTLCSLVLNFEPCNTKALFRRAKAALGLCNIWQAFCDLRKANRIDPNNIEIRREVHSQENLNKRAGKRPCLEADSSSEKKGKSIIIGTPYYGKEDERFFEVEEPSKPLKEDQTSVDGCDQTFFMSSTNGPNLRKEASCPRMSTEVVTKGDSMIRDLKMELDKCNTTLDTESTPTTYAEDDSIAKAGKVQHDDGKVMSKKVRKGELGACDSQCTNMMLDNGSYVKDDSSTQVEATKFCIEGDNSSSGSIMRVKEFDHMEELSTGACSSNANPKSVPSDATSVKSQGYFMRSAPTFKGKFATRNVVYKPIGNTTRRRLLKLLCPSEAA
ncbi:hypothetical protein Cgig2_033983 [Carnegiea gigantea]|uniref:Uncharacterized protein n=1 Tax=Carnegiea gigantea TaxID=171969 RepID=A0A9Q1JV02_9CARY|nr:hypothetical protein Cgig2_033983 [Carnegiea gigantea]